MNLSLTLNARDQTQGAIASALGGLGKVLSFAKNSAVGLAGINLGVRPLVSGLDNLIDRGTRLEVIRKQFSALTGTQGGNLDLLSKRIQIATSNTLRLGESMQIANRGLAMGVSFRQIVTAAEFATKKAAAIGEEPAALLERIVNDLGKGTTRVLDDLGLLRGGVEGVARAYDAIHGSKAFAGLGEAAQKSVIASAAVAEMSRSMKSLGVSGKETYFAWQGIKTQIGDATDKLILAVTSSKAMKGAIGGLRDFLAGVTEHFEKGGTFGQLLFGKGQSGGLAGVLGGLFKDAGAALWSGLGKGARGLWDEVLAKLSEWRDVLIAKLAALIVRIEQALSGAFNFGKQKAKDLYEYLKDVPIVGPMLQGGAAVYGNPQNALQSAPAAIQAGMGVLGTMLGRWLFGGKSPTSQPAGPQARAGMGFIPGVGPVPIGQMLATGMLAAGGGGGGSAAADAWAAFQNEFAGTSPGTTAQAASSLLRRREADAGPAYFLTTQGRINARASAARQTAQLDNLISGRSTQGMALRRAAAEAARARAVQLSREGYQVTSGVRQQLFADELAQLMQPAAEAAAGRARLSDEKLAHDNYLRHADADPLRGPVAQKIDELLAGVKQLILALGGTERDIARAGG